MTLCNILWTNCVESVDFSFFYNGQNLCYVYLCKLFPITFKHCFSYVKINTHSEHNYNMNYDNINSLLN